MYASRNQSHVPPGIVPAEMLSDNDIRRLGYEPAYVRQLQAEMEAMGMGLGFSIGGLVKGIGKAVGGAVKAVAKAPIAAGKFVATKAIVPVAKFGIAHAGDIASFAAGGVAGLALKKLAPKVIQMLAKKGKTPATATANDVAVAEAEAAAPEAGVPVYQAAEPTAIAPPAPQLPQPGGVRPRPTYRPRPELAPATGASIQDAIDAVKNMIAPQVPQASPSGPTISISTPSAGESRGGPLAASVSGEGGSNWLLPAAAIGLFLLSKK